MSTNGSPLILRAMPPPAQPTSAADGEGREGREDGLEDDEQEEEEEESGLLDEEEVLKRIQHGEDISVEFVDKSKQKVSKSHTSSSPSSIPSISHLPSDVVLS